MHQFDVLRAHTRGVRAKRVFTDGTIGSAHFQHHARTRFRQTLPGITGKLGLFIRGELVGKPANDTAGIEALSRHHDGFKHVGCWDNEQRNRLAFFFRHGDSRSEKFLLVVIEYLAGFEYRAPAEAMFAMIQAGAHDDDILLVRVGVAENVPQVIQIARIAHGDEHVAGANAHRTAAEFLIAVDPELIEALGLSLAFAGNASLGVGEDRRRTMR